MTKPRRLNAGICHFVVVQNDFKLRKLLCFNVTIYITRTRARNPREKIEMNLHAKINK